MTSLRELIIPQVQAQVAPREINAEGGTGSDLGEKFTLGIGGAPVKNTYDQPTDLLNIFTGNIFWVAGLIVTALVMYSGYKFISEGTKGKDEAKQVLTAAFGGLIIMFLAYWIVRIVEVVTGVTIFL